MVRMRVHTAPERGDVSYSLWRVLMMRIFATRNKVCVTHLFRQSYPDIGMLRPVVLEVFT